MGILARLVLLFLLMLGISTSTLPGIEASAPLATITPTDIVAVGIDNNSFSGIAAVSGDRTSGTCISTAETFLKLDLSGLTQAIGSAELKLTSSFITTDPGATLTMGLYGSTDTSSWSQASILWGSRPIPTTVLLSSAPLTAVGQPVVFANSADLASFLDGQRSGTQKATLVIKATACNNALGPVYQTMNNPVVTVLPPTAVTLRTFRSADPAVNWLLIVGLGALAAAVIGGLAVSRKRAARG